MAKKKEAQESNYNNVRATLISFSARHLKLSLFFLVYLTYIYP